MVVAWYTKLAFCRAVKAKVVDHSDPQGYWTYVSNDIWFRIANAGGFSKQQLPSVTNNCGSDPVLGVPALEVRFYDGSSDTYDVDIVGLYDNINGKWLVYDYVSGHKDSLAPFIAYVKITFLG